MAARSGKLTQHEQEWHAHHYDDEQTWTVDAYDSSLIAAMRAAGAVEQPSEIDGVLFRVDARQLIQYIANASGLIVEFRTRRRQQLSEEQRERLRQRAAAMNAQKKAGLLTGKGRF